MTNIAPQPTGASTARATMNGKPVHSIPATTVLNMNSGFSHKLLCDGPTFSTGTACVYSCAFCYVPEMMRKQQPYLQRHGVHGSHESVVIRRDHALDILRRQLTDSRGNPRYLAFDDTRVIYSSPLVDVAGNMQLVEETIAACKIILELTNWQIRLLSKSNLLPKVADGIPARDSQRLIYGVSTGTLDNTLARAFEAGAPLVSKRIESLHDLQDRGLRTFGMICPSLPQRDYHSFARAAAAAIRADRCEHVWTEVINVRGDSMTRTCAALRASGYQWEAGELERAAADKECWEQYSRATFEAHVSALPPGKLRQLQYVTAASKSWWAARQADGAVLL